MSNLVWVKYRALDGAVFGAANEAHVLVVVEAVDPPVVELLVVEHALEADEVGPEDGQTALQVEDLHVDVVVLVFGHELDVGEGGAHVGDHGRGAQTVLLGLLLEEERDEGVGRAAGLFGGLARDQKEPAVLADRQAAQMVVFEH